MFYCMISNTVCEVSICCHRDFGFVYKSCVETSHAVLPIMQYDRTEVEKSIVEAKLIIQKLQNQLKNVFPKCKRRLTFEDDSHALDLDKKISLPMAISFQRKKIKLDGWFEI